MRGKIVVTNFTLAPVLMAYSGAHLVMQPQFGMEPIRRPVEEYLKIMYHGTLEDLAKFCERYQADYVVFDRGFTGEMHPYSSRYIANSPEIKPDSPVNYMSLLPYGMQRFLPMIPPAEYRSLPIKYTVFKYIKDTDLVKSQECEYKAKEYLEEMEMSKAKAMILQGLKYNPRSKTLQKLNRWYSPKTYYPTIPAKE